jgi:hypothetical protein
MQQEEVRQPAPQHLFGAGSDVTPAATQEGVRFVSVVRSRRFIWNVQFNEVKRSALLRVFSCSSELGACCINGRFEIFLFLFKLDFLAVKGKQNSGKKGAMKYKLIKRDAIKYDV